MTLIASWLASDSRRPSSIYIVSDSRFSWGDSVKFDYGKKLFCFQNSPDILGYCGDVLFPTIILNQLIELGNSGILFNEESPPDSKFAIINSYIQKTMIKYPFNDNSIIDKSLDIIYATRYKNVFHLYILSWTRSNNSWSEKKVNLEENSKIPIVAGSGKQEFEAKYKEYERSNIKKTSRAVFQCFCDSLSNINDKYCGGSPQLVGLYQKWNGVNFGVISKKKRYFCGVEIFDGIDLDNIQWRNEDFEICSGITMEKFTEAQRQPNPIILQRSNSLTVH